MSIESILDGLEAELALERELGIRSVPCDRNAVLGALCLAPRVTVGGDPRAPRVMTPAPRVMDPAPRVTVGGDPRAPRPPLPESRTLPPASQTTNVYDFVFLHDRALSADGVTMMAKIVHAMGKTAETAPILFTGSLPSAKVYVVLGGNALKKWFPTTRCGPGQWISAPNAKNVLVTYSPAYILRFGEVTPAVQKLKHDMWTSLKSVQQRI